MHALMDTKSGKLIKEAMERKSLSAPYIAKEVGCGRQSVYHWRDGLFPPSKWAIPGLALVLGIPEQRLRRAVSADRQMRGKSP